MAKETIPQEAPMVMEDRRKYVEASTPVRVHETPPSSASSGRWGIISASVCLAAGIILAGILGASARLVKSNYEVLSRIEATTARLQDAEQSLKQTAHQADKLNVDAARMNQQMQAHAKAAAGVQQSLAAATSELTSAVGGIKAAGNVLAATAESVKKVDGAPPSDAPDVLLQSVAVRMRLHPTDLRSSEGASDGYVMKFTVPLLASIEPQAIRQLEVQLDLPEDLKSSVGHLALRGRVGRAGKLDIELIAPNEERAAVVKSALDDSGFIAVATIVVTAHPIPAS